MKNDTATLFTMMQTMSAIDDGEVLDIKDTFKLLENGTYLDWLSTKGYFKLIDEFTTDNKEFIQNKLFDFASFYNDRYLEKWGIKKNGLCAIGSWITQLFIDKIDFE